MALNTKAIQELRDKTGMGLADCKKALEANEWDVEKAELYLRKQGINNAAKKADRATGQGIVAVLTDGLKAAIINLACEQEPTANNEKFTAVLNNTLKAVLSSKAKTAAEAQAAAYPTGGTVQEAITGLIAQVGENVVLRQAVYLEAPAGGLIGAYAHFNKRTGAIIAIKGSGVNADDANLKKTANDICMHIVAMRTLAAKRSDIPASIIEKESAVFEEAVKDKPAELKKKILDGKLNGFYRDNVLVEQIYAMDDEGKLTVKALLDAAAKTAGGSAEILSFARCELGME
jgi:elongation factor Ts